MNELEQLKNEISSLKQRVDFLEETIKTLGDISSSETAKNYIEKRQQALAMSKLLNSAAPSIKINEGAQEKILNSLTKQKEELDKKIAEAVAANDVNVQGNDVEKLFNYVIKDDGIEIQSFNGFGTDILAVPNEISGLPVVGIGEEAFANLEVTEVFVPDSVRYIDDKAFKRCKQLRKVKLSQVLYRLGEEVFAECVNLNAVNLPNSLLRMGENCFSQVGITSVTIPKQMETITLGCFSNCRNLQNVVLNDKIKTIRSWAFGYTGITKLVIPEQVKLVESAAFMKCSQKLSLAILGVETKFDAKKSYFSGVIYCLPGSEVQKAARLNGIQVKPLSEFSGL